MIIKRSTNKNAIQKWTSLTTDHNVQKVAAIIIFHDHEKYFEELITSVVKQTHPFSQIIIILDCCKTVDLKNLLIKIINKVNLTTKINFSYDFYETNFGYGGIAFNYGFEKLKDDIKYIVHIDADNFLDLNFNKYCLEQFTSESIGMIYPKSIIINDDSKIIGEGPSKEFNLNLLQRKNYIDTCTMIRREAFIKWEKSGLDDWIFNIDLIHSGWDLKYSALATFYYRIHPGQVSETTLRNMSWCRYECHKKHFQKTIITALAGRVYCLDRYFKKINNLENIDTYKLLLVNTSPDENFNKLLSGYIRTCKIKNIQLINHPLFPFGKPPDQFTNSFDYRLTHELETSEILCDIYNKARENIDDKCEFVLFWEDDITFNNDDLKKLIYYMDENVDLISGLVNQRFGGDATEWQINDSFQAIRPKREGIFKTTATGFGCLLMRREILKKIRFRCSKDLRYYDWAFGIDCQKECLTWIVNSEVQTQHWKEDGSYV